MNQVEAPSPLLHLKKETLFWSTEEISSARRSLKGDRDSTTVTLKCSCLSLNSMGNCGGMSVIIVFSLDIWHFCFCLCQHATWIHIDEAIFSNQANFCHSIDAAKEDGSLGRLVNDDNINPNATIKKITVEGKPHLCLFARRDINPGEEITYNYGDDSAES